MPSTMAFNTRASAALNANGSGDDTEQKKKNSKRLNVNIWFVEALVTAVKRYNFSTILSTSEWITIKSSCAIINCCWQFATRISDSSEETEIMPICG